MKVVKLQTHHRKSAKTSQASRYETVQEIPISFFGQRERVGGAKSGTGEPEVDGEPRVERGSQKWIGEPEVDGGAKSGLQVIGIHLRDL